MPYREKKIYSGPILEVEIFPITKNEKKKPRAKKEKISAPKQKNLNDKNAKKHLIRLINTNFTNKDIVVHLTYTDLTLPQSEAEARRDVTNYLRRIKHFLKKNSLPALKYIAVIEFVEPDESKKRIRLHHHIVMSGIDRDIAEQLWGKGWANADRLQSNEFGYEALARYIAKDPKGSKRWTQSKNIKQPTVRVNDSKYSRKKTEQIASAPDDKQFFERLYPGYIFTKCQVEVNDISAGNYIYIKMRKADMKGAGT